MRLVVGITGATGAVFGIRLLEVLKATGVETELCISPWGARTVEHETSLSLAEVEALATHSHRVTNQAAPLSSGSFKTDGMIIAPCSMRTAATVAHGISDNLITRAADVTLKEGRTLVVVPRETPLSVVHLENLLKLAQLGVRIVPPMPAFYSHPQSVAEIVDHVVARVLDQVSLDPGIAPRWNGRLLRRADGAPERVAD